MTLDIKEENPGVITATSQDMSKKLVGRFMANLLIGSHQD
jgi:hypothetical protein